MSSDSLTLRDEIHGDITFTGILPQVIDHPDFQRLRGIKQLGLADFVFPCATHTRFQHSLGASYLAGRYFESLMDHWQNPPVIQDCTSNKSELHIEKTVSVVREVSNHLPSRIYWKQLVCVAALLHDIGHGPWSHTFENLELEQNFSGVWQDIDGCLVDYFKASEKRLSHEDISVIYCFQILRDLEKSNSIGNFKDLFLPLVSLINKSLLKPSFKAKVESDVASVLDRCGIKGGIFFHRLLRPLVSGPFDVDRMDYIQRDGRNCGVNIGKIEWRRIVKKLIPCLAKHPNDSVEPTEVVLITSLKNQHVLDDFVFSLFQMYTQVYMHPKIVGIEHSIKKAVQSKKGNVCVTFEDHRNLTDEKFREIIKQRFETLDVEDILHRKPMSDFEIAHSIPGSGVDEELKAAGFSNIESFTRPMMKERMGIFLYSEYTNEKKSTSHSVFPWLGVSPLAERFYSINYSPNFWIRRACGTKDASI